MKIITISREFGSGGRELGKRLADQLQFSYYDKEILTEISNKSGLDEGYVEKILENGLLRQYPITYGHSFSSILPLQHQLAKTELLLKQHQILKEFAQKGACVVIGRGADMILREYHPLNLFIYADLGAKISRCRQYSSDKEKLTKRELEKKIRQVDDSRARYYALMSDGQWGDKRNYHLCINTTELTIKEVVSFAAEYAKYWFGRNEK